MIYELRVYHCVPGRLPDLNKRFETITLLAEVAASRPAGAPLPRFYRPMQGKKGAEANSAFC
jgi:hypothetical protein